MSEGTVEREMTLREWCAKLPESHLANRQLNAIEQSLKMVHNYLSNGELSKKQVKLLSDQLDELLETPL